MAGLAAVFAAGFVIECFGGQGRLPTWQQISRILGLDQPLAPAEQSNTVRVTLLDVGQGDAALIEQNGEFCLIDAGTTDSTDYLLRALQQAGVQKLALLVMTHPHADHIGGMEAVLDTFPVDLLLLPDLSDPDSESVMLDRVLDAAKEKKVRLVQAQTGDVYPLGAGELTVLMAGYDPEENSQDDAGNDRSLCLRYSYGEFSFVDTGDAEQDAESSLAISPQALRATVFKAGHHGSSTSNTTTLLERMQPVAVGISCGRNNAYGHPHALALERMRQTGAQIWRTDESGTIVFEMTDGVLNIYGTAAEQPLTPAA